MNCKLDEFGLFDRRVEGQLPTVEAEAHEGNASQQRALSSERVFPPSLGEQTASATDRHDFGTRPSERPEERW